LKYRKEESGYLIRLSKGDILFDSIISFGESEKIDSAFFSGIGAVEDVVLGYYDLKKKEYIKREFDGIWELVSLTGNLAKADDGLIIHAHGVLSDPGSKTIGGHVFGFTTAATVEIYLVPLKAGLERKFDEETGLKLLDI
jgi:predicted DNA-binding protein with PD1-like motif